MERVEYDYVGNRIARIRLNITNTNLIKEICTEIEDFICCNVEGGVI